MTAEKFATEIRRAYDNYMRQYGRQNEWAGLAAIMERVDLSVEQLTEGIRYLLKHDSDFNVVPESAQWVMRPIDHACAVWIGDQWKHNITWGA